MSESKKVALVSFAGSKTADKDVEKVAKTFRILFDLTRTDEDTCPIFNYKEELAAAKKKEKLTKNDIDKPLHKDQYLDQDDDDDVRRIASEMEAKYGVSGAPKKKRKSRKDDYADIGMGYDESDSFIDNTDGYDEMIPQNVTTLHGGFYINCGALEFKTDDEASSNIYSSSSSSDDSSDNDAEDHVKKDNRKRLLSDSDEESSEIGKKRPVKNPKLANNSQQKMKKNFLSPYKIKPKKKRILPIPSELRVQITEEAPTANKETAEDETDNKLTKDNEDLVNKKPMCLDNIIDIINSVAKGQRASSNDFLNNLPSCSTPFENANHINMDVEDSENETASKSAPNNMPNDDSVTESKDEPIKVHEEELVLPENLPSNILNIINAIKQAAAINIANNTSVFSSQVNNLIISFENTCKCLGKQSRSKVYAYLAAFTKYEKDAFIIRAKNLVLEEDDAKLRQNIDLLRKKINEVMPALRDNYENMRSHVEMQKLFNEDVKNLRMPKKTFPWTEKIKKWIRDIYSLKRKYFISQGVAKEILDVQMESYFKADVQILWPDSWVSMHYLIKVAKIDNKECDKPANPIAQTATNSKPTKPPNSEKDDTLNINGNSAISNATVLKSNIEVFNKQTVNNDETSIKKEATLLLTSAKTTDAAVKAIVCNSSTKISEKTVPVFAVPTSRLLQKPNLPQVSIIPVNPSSTNATPSTNQNQTNSRECEIVNISCNDEQQKEPVNRIKTISEILKMNRAKKDAAAAAAAAASIRSSSPNLVNSAATCQIIDLTANSSDLEQVKKRPKFTNVDNAEDTSVIVQQKAGLDTAEIQKVMEDLKALQQMTYSQSTSSQHKPSTIETSSSSSTSNQQSVTVTALNKNGGKTGTFSSSSDTSFQEAFQRQFVASLQQQQQQQQQSSASSSALPNSYNNIQDKSSSSPSCQQIRNKTNTTSIKNYEPSSAGNVKINSHPSKTQSAYNIMDDMLANFLSEYGFPLTGQKPKKPSQK